LIAAVQLIKALGGGWDEKPILAGSAKVMHELASY
jgi:hypothetical protein